MPTVGILSSNKKTIPSAPPLVWQGRLSLYQVPDEEYLSAAIHTYLESVENVQIMHWSNTTNAPQRHKLSQTTETKIMSGSKIGENLDIKETFDGASVGGTTIEAKVFTSQETASPQTQELDITIPANSDLWFYQRKYNFRSDVTWILNAWGQDWNVGSQGGYHVQEGHCRLAVLACDFVTSDAELRTTSSADFDGIEYEDQRASATRKWGDTTQMCQDTLRRIGIDGSQLQ